MSIRVGINGFGRIGRCLYRVLHEKSTGNIAVAVINDVMPIENAAYLLENDSNYGRLNGGVSVNKGKLVINDKPISYFQEEDANKASWDKNGINIIVESTGHKAHIKSNALRLYTDNLEWADVTIVYGINHQQYNPVNHKVVSLSTCTGNAIVPVAKVIHDIYRIKAGHLVTIHPALSDQRVVDGPHKRYNQGRSQLDAIIPTYTGITESLVKFLPHLDGKLSGISYRVPTRVVSAIDAHFELESQTTSEDINLLLKEKSLDGVILVDDGSFGHQKVSTDFLKDPHSVIVSSLDTKVTRNHVSLSLFHDNEWGFCCRIADLIEYINSENERK